MFHKDEFRDKQATVQRVLLGWAGHVKGMRGKRKSYRVLVGISEEKTT